MKHQIIVQDADGRITERIDVTDGLEITLKVGEDVVLLDESGKASDAKLKPEGNDLVLVYDEGVEVTLVDFYAEVAAAEDEPVEQADPVEVAFEGGVQSVDAGGAGSEGLGNLQSDSAFTLINGSIVALNDQGGVGLGNVQGFELAGGGDGRGQEAAAPEPQVITETENNFFTTAVPQPAPAAARSSNPGPTPQGPTTIEGDLDDPEEAPKIDPTKDITVTSLETGDVGDPGESVVGGNSSIVFNEDGSYIVTIDPDSTAGKGDSEIFRVVYTDDGDVTRTQDIIVEYDGEGSANVHPFSEDADLSLVADDGPTKGDLVGYDTDGDTVSHVILGNPEGSFGSIVIDDPETGEYTYTPDISKSPAPGETVTDSFEFVVIDEDGATSTSSITVNITGADVGPKATDDAFSITEDGGVDLTAPGLLANDTNDGGGTNRIDSFFVDDQGFIVEEGKEVSTTLGNGTLTIGSDGQASFDAQGGYDELVEGETVIESLTYSVRDESGKSSQASVTFTINGQNDGPEITKNDFPIKEGEPLILTPPMIDVDDPDNGPDELTWCPQDITGGYFDLVANPGVPITEFTQQQVIDGEIRFVDDGDETPPTFTLYVKDPDGLDDEDPSNIRFNDDNDAPEILENVLDVAEGGSVVLSQDELDTTDPDNTADEILLTPSDVIGGQFELVADPGNAIASFTQEDVYDGKVRFVHNGDEPAPSYTITATDPGGLSDTSDAAITYTPVNDGPEILIAKLPIDEGETVILDDDKLYSEDPDHGPEDLTYTVTKVDHGEFQLVSTGVPVTQFTQEQVTNGEIQFVHDGSEDAPCFTVEVSDPPGLIDEEDGEIVFGSVNDGPEILTNVLTVEEGGSQVFGPSTLNAEDPDHGADELTYSIDSIVGGEFQRDGSTVTSFTQEEVNDGRVAFVHDGSETTPEYTLTVRDPLGLTDTDAADINYTAVNDGPEITVATLTVAEGGDQLITTTVLNAVDPDNTATELTYTVDSAVGGDFLKGGVAVTTFTQQDLESGLIRFQHDGSETEPDYQVTVRDPLGLFDVADAEVSYTAVNDGPEITVFDLTVSEGGTQTFNSSTLAAEDPDNTPEELTYTVTDVEGGEFQKDGLATVTFTQKDVDDGRVTYVHDGSETEPVATVRVADPGGLFDIEDAAINYTPVNDGPEITVATLTVEEGGAQVITTSVLNAIDPDHAADELTYTVDGTTGGDFVKGGVAVSSFTQEDLESGLIRFQHDGSETEPDYQVTVRDPLGLLDTADADVSYTPVNDGPVITAFDLTVEEGGTQTFSSTTLAAEDPDNTPEELTYTVTDVVGGEFQKDGVVTTTFTQKDVADGKVTYVHDGSETEPEATVRVADPAGLFDIEDAAVNYTPVNDAPEITVAELTVEEGGTQVMTTGALSATDPDNTAAELTFSVDSTTAGEFQKGGVAVTQFTQADLESGTVSFVHDGSEIEPDYVVTVRDLDLAFDTADAEVNYTPVNDAPEILTNELTINRAETLLVTNSILSTGDPDHEPEDLTIEVSNVEHGFFASSSTPSVPITSFTQADIDDGKVAFVHDGGTEGPSYDVRVTDPLGLFDTGSVAVDFTTFPLSPKITAVGLNLPDESSAISIMVDDFSDLSGETYATSGRLGSGSYWSGDDAIASGGVGTRNGQVFEEGDGQKTMSATADGIYIFNNTLGNPSDTTNPIFSREDIQLLAGASYTVNIDVASHQPFNFPNLQLYINDEFIGSKVTNSTAWKTYSLNFTVPEDVTAVDIKVINATATDVGNDFGMDNITLDLNAFEVSVKDFNISVSDPDTEPEDITITVDNVVSGAFVFASNPSVALTEFTLQDVLTEKLKFFHLAQEDLATYDLTASDPDGNSDSISGAVGQPPNDAPVFENLVIDMGTANLKVLDSSDISVADSDATPGILNFLVRNVEGGQFEFVDTSGIAIDSFSQQNINEGEVQFRRFDDAVTVEYQLEVTDGATVILDTGSASRTAGPIVLDLDGDGVEFRSVQDGIHFDADGDGAAEQIAWAGRDDAVLFYDANDDGQVGGREEVVLSDYGPEGSTDLDGLRTFDSDADGQLSAGDAEFEKFGLWQDADGDGVASEGEVVKLMVAGVQSIDLGSDGEGYVAHDGDVEVFGTTQLTYEDGTVIDAADAAFDYIELANADEPIVIEADDGEEIVVEAPVADEFGIIAEVVDEPEALISAPSATDAADEEALAAATAAA